MKLNIKCPKCGHRHKTKFLLQVSSMVRYNLTWNAFMIPILKAGHTGEGLRSWDYRQFIEILKAHSIEGCKCKSCGYKFSDKELKGIIKYIKTNLILLKVEHRSGY